MTSISKWLALDKLSNFIRIIKQNGGPCKSLSKLYRQDALKIAQIFVRRKSFRMDFDGIAGRPSLLRIFTVVLLAGRQLLEGHYVTDGVLVGKDELGNRYYENPRYFMPRDRWVEYADYVHLEFDGSQVPAEWYGWLHHKTDMLPCEEEIRARRCWSQPHTENLSGTTGCYIPYSTTRPTIIPWDGKPRSRPPPPCDEPKAVDQCKPKCKPVDC